MLNGCVRLMKNAASGKRRTKKEKRLFSASVQKTIVSSLGSFCIQKVQHEMFDNPSVQHKATAAEVGQCQVVYLHCTAWLWLLKRHCTNLDTFFLMYDIRFWLWKVVHCVLQISHLGFLCVCVCVQKSYIVNMLTNNMLTSCWTLGSFWRQIKSFAVLFIESIKLFIKWSESNGFFVVMRWTEVRLKM